MKDAIKKAIEKILNQIEMISDFSNGVVRHRDYLRHILTDLVEEVEEEKNKAIQAAKAYQELCTHYRIGKTPSEKLFKRLDAANMFLKQIEKELEGNDDKTRA
jgi:5'-deoxynucleotidase YfbR-like HD superfamily hydrolase